MKSYVFQVELAHEDDGRWSTWIDVLPGCAAWGYTKEEALQAIQDAAEAYIEDMIEAGETLPSCAPGVPGAQGRQYDDDLHARAAARWARGTQSARSALSSVTHRPRSLSPQLKPSPGK